MKLILLFLLAACSKQISPGDISAARDVFIGKKNCPDAMKELLLGNDNCPELRYAKTGELEVWFQCHKDDSERKDFWDTMVFKVSPWSMAHNSVAAASRNPRLICLDDYIMVEAYHPLEVGIK